MLLENAMICIWLHSQELDLANVARDANSIGKDFGGDEKASVAFGIRIWHTATRWNKVLEGINNLRRFLFFHLAPGERADRVSEASIREKSGTWRILFRIQFCVICRFSYS